MKNGYYVVRLGALAAVIATSVWIYVCFAATQGILGTTSSGSVTISVTKPPRANISNLSDLTVANWVIGSGGLLLTDDVCVYSTRPSGGYTVKAIGSGASGAFSLANLGRTLPYSVIWNAGGVGGLSNSGSTMTPNTTSVGFNQAANDSSGCNGAVPGPTARIVITVLESDLEAAAAGTYSGTLTLIVTPN